jgi:hypothetical protein
MAYAAEQSFSLSVISQQFSHVQGFAKLEPYDSSVLPSYDFSRAHFFAKVLTAGTNLELVLPEIGIVSSFHLVQYTGDAADELTLTPYADDEINGGGVGVAKVFTSDGTPLKFVVFAAHNQWHISSVREEPINLIAGAGISITGTYPDITITNLNP